MKILFKIAIRRNALCIILLFFGVLGVFCQEREVFAPFVSRLKAQAEDTAIILSWQKSNDVEAGYVIFRHSAEITDSNYEEAVRVSDVGPDVQSYTDYPPDTSPYYYAVLGKNAEGSLYRLFIPFRNKTTSAYAVKTPPSEEQSAAKITGIKSTASEEFITITFKASPGDRNLIVYRGTAPFKTPGDLSGASLVKTVSSSSEKVIDYPVPGIEYYYGIIDSGMLKIGNIQFVQGENSTIDAAVIAPGKRVGLPPASSNISRTMPLPLLPLDLAVQTGQRLGGSSSSAPHIEKSISKKTEEAIKKLYSIIPKREKRDIQAVLLPEDTVSHEMGEAYSLQTILQGPFKNGQWEQSVVMIDNFLRIHRSEEIEARARFYLGQALYFSEKKREAFIEFLLSGDIYYASAREWIDIIFEDLREESL